MKCLFVILISVFFGLSPAPTNAQISSDDSATATEKAGFSFYKLSGAKPPFMDWVKSRAEWLDADPRDKLAILNAEINRLRNAYDAHIPKENLVTLPVTVNLVLPDKNTRQSLIQAGQVIPMTIDLNTYTPYEGYFPLSIGYQWLALIPNDIDSLLNVNLSPIEFTKIEELLGLKRTQSQRKAYADITFMPTAIDDSQPMQLNDNINAWLMMVDVASIVVYADSARNNILWIYNAPWYVSSQSREILDLHGQ